MDEEVCAGPGYLSWEFGKDNCDQFLELMIRDSTVSECGDNLLGTLVVDDVEYPGAKCERRYTDDDLKQLRPVASYMSRVLALHRGFERDQALARYARVLRNLEALFSSFDAASQDALPKERADRLRAYIAQQVTEAFRAEPNFQGCHFRFVDDDGSLKLFPGFGAYSVFADADTLDPEDAMSMSARCLSDGKTIWKDVREEPEPAFVQFEQRVRGLNSSAAEVREALSWCKTIRVLACSPVLWGKIRVGVVAIQSDAADLISTDSLQFIEDVCKCIARVLGPIRHEQEYFEFWENAAYAFRGPASNMLDIAERHWIFEKDPERRREEEPKLAFAQQIFSMADTFRFASGREGEVVTERSRQVLRPLWARWCALFRGISGASRKQIELVLPSDSDVSAFVDGEVNTDATLLTEIVYNVFENAWKACRRCVWVRAFGAVGSIHVEVSDDGRGISVLAYEYMVNEAGEERFHEDFEIDSTRGFGLGWKWSRRHARALGVELSVTRNGVRGGASVEIVVPTL